MLRKHWGVYLGTVDAGSAIEWERHRTRRRALKAARLLAAFAEMRLAVEHDDGTVYVMIQHDAHTKPAYYREVHR